MIRAVAQTNATASYFENMPLLLPGSTTIANSVSTVHVVPFVLPHQISASFIRVPVTMSHTTSQVAGTSANTSFTFNRSYGHAVVFYAQGTGANSMSLQSLTSAQASFVCQTSITAGAVGSNYTVAYNITYPVLGTTSQYTTNFAVTRSAYDISSESMTLFTGPRFLDIPFAASLSPGNYWAAFGMSTGAASNAGPAGISNASVGFSTIGVSQSNISWGYPGAATNNSIQVQPGLGIFTTNSSFHSTASIGLAQISAVVSNPKMYFQAINRA